MGFDPLRLGESSSLVFDSVRTPKRDSLHPLRASLAPLCLGVAPLMKTRTEGIYL